MFALTHNKGNFNPWNDVFGITGRNRVWDLFDQLEKEVVSYQAKTALKEDNKSFYITAELPGIDKEDLDIEIDRNVLTITAERKKPEEKEGENLHYDELQYGKYIRRFNVSENILSDKIEAIFKDGLLTVTVPKAEKKKPKQIKVK